MADTYTLYEKYDGDTNQDEVYLTNATRHSGMTFTPAITHNLGKIALRIHYPLGNKPDSVKFSIRATAGGKPTGPDLTAVTVPTDGWATASPGILTEFIFPTPLEVVADTMYAIVVKVNGTDPIPKAKWRMDNAIPHYDRGDRQTSGDGTIWNTTANFEWEFYEYGLDAAEGGGDGGGGGNIPTDVALFESWGF